MAMSPNEIVIDAEVLLLMQLRRQALHELDLIEIRLQEKQAEQLEDEELISKQPKLQKVLAMRAAAAQPRELYNEPSPQRTGNGFQFREINLDLRKNFPCSCGREFLFYLEREKHISEGGSDCGRFGEYHWQNGQRMHVTRDTTIKGDPVKSVTKKSKIFTTIPDDIEY